MQKTPKTNHKIKHVPDFEGCHICARKVLLTSIFAFGHDPNPPWQAEQWGFWSHWAPVQSHWQWWEGFPWGGFCWHSQGSCLPPVRSLSAQSGVPGQPGQEGEREQGPLATSLEHCICFGFKRCLEIMSLLEIRGRFPGLRKLVP